MILICGGAGYIGSHVNKLISAEGEKTLVADNLVRGHREFCRWGEFEQGDIGDAEFLDGVFSRHKIRAVMHLCAYTYVGESVQKPEMYYDNNLKNTVTLLNAMARHGVKNFIFSSTAAVFGAAKELPLTEKSPLAPVNPYGRSKLMVETLLPDYEKAHGLRSVCLRYFNAAGADPEAETGEWHTPETHLIPLALDAAAGLRPSLEIFGKDYPTADGTCVRDYIHVNDIAQAHLLALSYLEKGGKSDCFNMGNGKGFSIMEVLKTAEAVTGKNIPVNFGARRPGDPPALVASSELCRATLGWKPRHAELSDIIETAWRWHRKLDRMR